MHPSACAPPLTGRTIWSRVSSDPGFANGQNVYEGDPLSSFHEYTIDLNWETTGRRQPIVFGDNQLAVRLAPSPDKKEGEVSIEELECYVYVRK